MSTLVSILARSSVVYHHSYRYCIFLKPSLNIYRGLSQQSCYIYTQHWSENVISDYLSNIRSENVNSDYLSHIRSENVISVYLSNIFISVLEYCLDRHKVSFLPFYPISVVESKCHPFLYHSFLEIDSVRLNLPSQFINHQPYRLDYRYCIFLKPSLNIQ